jgi:hypothetical protein
MVCQNRQHLKGQRHVDKVVRETTRYFIDNHELAADD